jgi:hypothetical protein
VRPSESRIRIVAALIVAAGLVASALAILAEELDLGGEGALGWKRITLLAAGGVTTTLGALFFARPRIVLEYVTSQRVRIDAFQSAHVTSQRLRIGVSVAVGVVIGAWLVLVARQVVDGGFYSDDWAILEHWRFEGYFGAVSTTAETLGSKPLLAIALPAPYAAFGSDPALHHVLATGLVLASVAMFFFVLRGLRFATRDAVPIALMALLFPWASAVRLWPTGSLNNLAVLLLFAGLLIALWGLRVGGRRGFLIHLGAAGCYAASILTYETTTVVVLMLWPAYIWLQGWRPALPRALLDVSAAGAAAVYSAANTVKTVPDFSEQLSDLPTMLRDGAHLLAASLVPVLSPGEFPLALTAAIFAAALAVLAAALVRGGRAFTNDASSQPALSWAAVAAVALAALALCWAIYLGSGFTPTLPGLWDRVNVVALYPAAVFVYAVLRTVGCLISKQGYFLAVAGCMAIAVGYWVHDLRHQRDWARAAQLQEPVLASVERASPSNRSVVLTFGHPAEVAPSVPVFNASWDLFAAARVRTRENRIDTYPVYVGSRLHCSIDGVTMDYLASPMRIDPEDNGTPRTPNYSRVVFVDAADRRHATIQSRKQCRNGVREFTPGPFRASP